MQQLRLIDAHHRFPLLVALLACVPIVMLSAEPTVVAPEAMLSIAGPLAIPVAWPFFVWVGELPRQRGYHRHLPVNHVLHDLVKVLAGACWLMLGVGIVVSAQLLIALVAGFDFMVWGISPTAVLNQFTGALIIYLIMSTVPILTNKPLEWLLGMLFSGMALGALTSRYTGSNERPEVVLELVFGGDLGLINALTGAYTSQPWDYLLELSPLRIAPPHSTGLWLIATALWIGLGLSLVLLASCIANRRSNN